MAAQLNHQFASNLTFNLNYTWSKAMDFNQYIGTGSPSNNELDPTNQQADYGLGSNDVRNRFVAHAVYTPQFNVTRPHEVPRQRLDHRPDLPGADRPARSQARWAEPSRARLAPVLSAPA